MLDFYNGTQGSNRMKLGIVLTSHSAETNWNALRLANLSLVNGDEIKIFLMGEGVEYAKTGTEKFNINQQIDKLTQHPKFAIYACGTCLKLRNDSGSDTCPLSTLQDLYEVIAWADKVLTF